MREIRKQEQAEKMKGREIIQAISEAVAATRFPFNKKNVENYIFPFLIIPVSQSLDDSSININLFNSSD